MIIVFNDEKNFLNYNIDFENNWILNNSNELNSIYSKNDPNKKFKTEIKISNQSVKISRSYSGEIPLFYYLDESKIIVSDSIIKIKKKINPQINYNYCYEFIYSQFPSSPETFFKNVYQLKNNSSVKFVKFNEKQIIENDLFDINSKELRDDDDQICKNLRHYIKEAHKNRLGEKNSILLSGGIDSQVMAITLKKDLNIENIDALHFYFEGIDNELEYASAVCKELNLNLKLCKIDPNLKINLNEIVEMNAPAPSKITLNKLIQTSLSSKNETIFTGQDTRLHTPYLNNFDINFIKISKNKIFKFLKPFFNFLLKSSNLNLFLKFKKIDRALKIFYHSNNPNQYLINRYFHMLYLNYEKKNKQMMLIKSYSDKLIYSENFRCYFNSLTKVLWDKKWVFDMNSLSEIITKTNNTPAFPFLDEDFIKYSSKIPFLRSIKSFKGFSSYHHKYVKVNKYFLRKSYSGELSDRLILRNKAVMPSLHLLFNNGMNDLIEEFMNYDFNKLNNEISNDLQKIAEICKIKHNKWANDDHWLMIPVFNAIIILHIIK